MIKALIFDADGVVIKDHEYFSVRYTQEFGVPLDENAITNFFKTDFKLCSIGKADLKEMLEPQLSKWGWEGTLDELLTYWFEGEKEVDRDLIDFIKNKRDEGYKCYLASDNESYRANHLLDVVGLKEHFDYTFFSCFQGHSKGEKEFFEKIVEQTGLKPEEIFYTDDDQENLDVAKTLGINTWFYDDYKKLTQQIEKLLNRCKHNWEESGKWDGWDGEGEQKINTGGLVLTCKKCGKRKRIEDIKPKINSVREKNQ